jgi:hypothetical protein
LWKRCFHDVTPSFDVVISFEGVQNTQTEYAAWCIRMYYEDTGPCHLRGIFFPPRVNSLPSPKGNLMSCALSSFLFPQEDFIPFKGKHAAADALFLANWLSVFPKGVFFLRCSALLLWLTSFPPGGPPLFFAKTSWACIKSCWD